MPETIGLAILAAAAPEAVGVAGFSLASTTVFGIGLPTILGTTALVGAAIGLQYALNNPEVPKPESGAQPLKQAVPPRQRGYWVNRLAGVYVCFLAAGTDSQDVLAFHQGPIEQVIQVYFHDQPINTTPVISDGVAVTVNTVGALGYKNVALQIFYGGDSQVVGAGLINSGNTGGNFTATAAGKGVACLAMLCPGEINAEDFTKRYPQNLPLPSVVCKCAPIWDPRDGTQDRFDRSTWKASDNPVLQLIDYLTETDGGMGLDLDEILPADVLAQWMVEASLCDVLVGGVKRYSAGGWYKFDNAPENVIGKILASCDGWFSEDGEGRLVLQVGVYREPAEPALTDKHIVAPFSFAFGQPDEDAVNELAVSYTSPALGYVTDQVGVIRDEDAISLSGMVRSKPLELSWVQNAAQAFRLGERAMLRLNPAISGSFTTTLAGLRHVGKRWVKLQYPIEGLRDCVVEIQDKAEIDLLGGRVKFLFRVVDPVALAALD